MKIPKIPKKVVWAVIGLIVFIVASLALAGLVALDVSGNFATGSEKLTPDGTATGKALVVYDPGVSGTAKDAATKIANGLKAGGYEVVLAGVRSADAANTSGYDVIVAGGPVYAGKAGSSVYSYLQGLKVTGNAEVGAFATGKYRSEDKIGQVFPSSTDYKVAAILFPDEDDVGHECAVFVEELLK